MTKNTIKKPEPVFNSLSNSLNNSLNNAINKTHSAVLITNFGDESIALIQWALERRNQQKIQSLEIITVDTGWAAPQWASRVQLTSTWLESLGIKLTQLIPPANFTELVQTQGKFPTRKFQWCANFLKALPILDYLDEIDPQLNKTILLARRRSASRVNFDLPEFIPEEPKWGDRSVWHPLYLCSQEERDALIQKTPLPILGHRSLECDPCVNSDQKDLLRMDLSVIQRTADLEKKLSSQFLDPDLYQNFSTLDLVYEALLKANANFSSGFSYDFSSELFDMGCGNTFGCGL